MAITRRQFVTGGLATGAVGVVGGGVVATRNIHGTRRFLHRHGLLSGPDQAIPNVQANVEYGTLHPYTGAVNFGAYVPDGRVEAVLYGLHGRGGSHRDTFESIGVHKFIAARGLPWAVASLDGGEAFWHQRHDGTNTDRDLVDVLMPMMIERTGSAKSIVIGWSMGGYGALLLPQKHSGRFVAAIANSPSIWPTFSEATPGAFDDAADFAANDVLADVAQFGNTAVRVDCGEDDPFAGAVGDLHKRAPDLDVNIRSGFHEDASWRSYLPGQLDFIQAHLGT